MSSDSASSSTMISAVMLDHMSVSYARQRELHTHETQQGIFSGILIAAASVRCVPNKPCLLYRGRLYFTDIKVEQAIRKLCHLSGGEVELDLTPHSKGVHVYYKPPGPNQEEPPQTYDDLITDEHLTEWLKLAEGIAKRHPEWVPLADPSQKCMQQQPTKTEESFACLSQSDLEETKSEDDRLEEEEQWQEVCDKMDALGVDPQLQESVQKKASKKNKQQLVLTTSSQSPDMLDQWGCLPNELC
jgi:hypothetical protein